MTVTEKTARVSGFLAEVTVMTVVTVFCGYVLIWTLAICERRG